MIKFKFLSISVFLLVFSQSATGQAATDTAEYSFAVDRGDTMVIDNDHGRVWVRGSDQNRVQVLVYKRADDSARLRNVEVVSQKAGSRIFLQSYFYDYSSESVDMEVHIPRWINLAVSGANPNVDIAQVEGYVRVQTLSGTISVEDLTSSVSLMNESGDIFFRTRLQPQGDIRLESVDGTIHCQLTEGLNLRGWTRAGGGLSWNGEVQMNRGHLEKQVGSGGPLLYAGSLNGNVELRFVESLPSQSAEQYDSDDIPERSAPGTPASGEGPVVTGSSPGPSGSINTGYRLRVNVDWIYLNVSVRDRYNNRTIPHLQRENFLVYEDGVEQAVEKFSTAQAPFSLLLLLDVSGSTRDSMDVIREASINFTREIKSNDRIAVAVFNSDVDLIQGFTNDRRKVEGAIGRIRSGGGTAFYDALSVSIGDYMKDVEGRKAVVVFSDGVDNQLTGQYSHGSQTTFDELYRQIREISTIIYPIFLNTEDQAPQYGGYGGPSRPRGGGGLGDILIDILKGRTPPYSPGPGGGGPQSAPYEQAREQLRLIAEQTGGRMYAPEDIGDLAGVYTEIANDLRVQYTLAYTSTNPQKDGEWHRIAVEIRNKPDLVARTRQGYYSGRSQQASK